MCLVALQKNFRKIFFGVWKRRRKTQIQKNTSHNLEKNHPRRQIQSDDRAVDRDHSAVVVDDFIYFLGCGFCFLICVFLLLFQTPNTRKYFSENFLKCNQTHGNIFLFRKLAFSENMYFPENVLQQPNTA